jgi:SPP1 family predicted phage head-tail adaptor
MIQASKLTEKVELCRICYSGTSTGEQIPYYETIKTVFFSITNQRGNKVYTDGEQYRDRISFYGRYTQLAKKGTVVKYNDEYYNIVNVSPVQRNAAIILECQLVS